MGFAFDSMFAWFLVAVAVIVITVLTSHRFTRRSRQFTNDLKKIATENSDEVQRIIKERLSPTIHLHDGLDAVARRAARIIGEVAKYDRSDRLIEFFGAASLAATENKVKSPAELGDEQRAPSHIYNDAIDVATTKDVRMKRYISLFTPTQLRERSLPVQSQYLYWLKRQVQLLDAYSKYELADVVRAPNWGTNMARIITKNHVMEITGNGKAAIVITDEHIAQRINQYAHDSVIGKNAKNALKIYCNSSEATAPFEDFENYILEVEKIYKEEKCKREDESATAEPEDETHGSAARDGQALS